MQHRLERALLSAVKLFNFLLKFQVFYLPQPQKRAPPTLDSPSGTLLTDMNDVATDATGSNQVGTYVNSSDPLVTFAYAGQAGCFQPAPVSICDDILGEVFLSPYRRHLAFPCAPVYLFQPRKESYGNQ